MSFFQPGDRVIRYSRGTEIVPLDSTGMVTKVTDTPYGKAVWVSWDHLTWPDKENWYLSPAAEEMFVIDGNKPREGTKIIVLDSPNNTSQDYPSYLDLD